MDIQTSYYAEDSMSILTMGLRMKHNYNVREEYKKALVAMREEQVYRRGPDYVSTFDWNNSCGAEDAACAAADAFRIELHALRLAFQLKRGIGNLLKKHTDIVLGL